MRVDVSIVSKCCMCSHAVESPDHIFVECAYASVVWRRFAILGGNVQKAGRGWEVAFSVYFRQSL